MSDICCPLCTSQNLVSLTPAKDSRTYFHCRSCALIFCDPSFHLDREKEKEIYDYHENSIEQPGYVSFLNRVIKPGLRFIQPHHIGLDYGCGPVPTLSKILARQEIKCYDYDPIYGFEAPQNTYDFIFATECFEHFFSPKNEIERIKELLNPKGYLLIMTEVWQDLTQFEQWYYKKDPTHVIFFHKDSFHYMCQFYEFKLCYTDDKRVFIFQKN